MSGEALSFSDVNPNVDVGAEEQVGVKGGENLSFDELESALDAKSTQEEEKPEKPEDTSPTNEDTTQAEEPEEEETPPDKKEDDQEPEKVSVPDETRQEVRTVKTKYDGEEMELYGDLTIPTKVAGKTEQVALSELMDNYSGKVDYNRKYGELGSQKADLQKQVDEHTSQVEEMQNLVGQMLEATQDNPLKLFDVISEIHDVDPVKLKMEAIRSQVQAVAGIAKMDDTERERWFKEQELKFREEHLTSKENRGNAQKATEAQRSHESQVREQYHVNDESYSQAYELTKNYKEDQNLEGKPTPEEVVQVHRHLMAEDAILATRKDWAEELQQGNNADRETLSHYVSQLRDIALKNPEFDQADLEDIINNSVGVASQQSSAQNLGRKVMKTQPAPKENVSGMKGRKSKKPITFDDLDD